MGLEVGGGQSCDSGVCGNRALCFARSRLPAGDGKPRLRPRWVMARGKPPEGPHPPGLRKACPSSQTRKEEGALRARVPQEREGVGARLG